MAGACSIDDFVEYGGVIGVDDGASEGVAGSLKVDGSHDARLELKTGAAIDVPKGAVTDEIELSMERPSDEKAVSLVKSLKDYQAIVSLPYVLTPHGTKFREPVTIELPITKQTDKKLVVGWLENENDKKWKKLGDPIIKDGVAKIDIDHFSVVILLEEDRANLSDSGEAGGETSAGSSGADSGTVVGSGGTSTSSEARPDDAPFPSGATLDAGSSSGASGGAPDAAFPIKEPVSAPLPFPPPDATITLPAEAGAPAPTDASSGTGVPVDAGVAVKDAG